jgi:hypothetical protein
VGLMHSGDRFGEEFGEDPGVPEARIRRVGPDKGGHSEVIA